MNRLSEYKRKYYVDEIKVIPSKEQVTVTICDAYTEQFFSGTAICSPADKFDATLGVDIAERRALLKMFQCCIEDGIDDLILTTDFPPER